MPATVMRHPSARNVTPQLDCPCGCGGTGGCVAPPCPPCDPWGGLMKCWNDIQKFRAFMQDMINSLAINVPIRGVTDGTPAAPGIVGEFYQNVTTTQVTIAASDRTTTMVSAGVLAPGDWDVQAIVQPEFALLVFSFYLAPVPPGVSNEMSGGFSSAGGAGTAQDWDYAVSGRAQALITVPTLFAFAVDIGVNDAVTAGNLVVTLTARRMR